MKRRSARFLRPIVEPLEVRLPLAAGDLDPTFARFSTDPGIRDCEFVFSAVENLPGGRLLAVGSSLSDSPTSEFDGDRDFQLLAIQPDGYLDTSWGRQGWSTVAFNLDGFGGHNMDSAAGVAIQRDGKIVVVG